MGKKLYLMMRNWKTKKDLKEAVKHSLTTQNFHDQANIKQDIV